MANYNKKENWGQEKVKPGDNRKYLSHAMKIAKWDRVDVEDDNAIIERLDKYFNLCLEDDIKPTVSGMANALKISRFTLYDWKTGYRRSKTDRRGEIINYYYGLLEELYEDYMMNGKVNPVSGIFMGKNHFGYKDQSEVVVNNKSKFDESINPEDVRKKYLESTNDLLIEGEEVEDKKE